MRERGVTMSESVAHLGPVAQRVANRLRRQVLSGQLREGMPLPSVRNLAASTGIGVVTANRVLKRIETEGWAERRAGRCLRVTKDAVARAHVQMRRNLPPMICLVHSIDVQLGMEAEITALSSGYAEVFPGCSFRQVYLDFGDLDGFDRAREMLRQDSVLSCEVGYVLVGLPRAAKQVFCQQNVPCVVHGYAEPDLNLPCVYEDMRRVGVMAGEILCRGQLCVAVCGPRLIGAEVELLDGVHEAARNLGRPGPRTDLFHVHLPIDIEQAEPLIERLLTRADRPDGLLVLRPEHALACTRVAARHDIAVPGQLQVIGLHHHPTYRLVYPAITSIGPRSLSELGRRCARLLAEAMGRRHDSAPREIIESTLVEGESTLPRSNLPEA